MDGLQVVLIPSRGHQHRDTDVFGLPVGVDGDAMLIFDLQALRRAHVTHYLLMMQDFT